MVRVIFDGSNLRLQNFQQYGSGPIAYYEGLPFQRGYGYYVGRQRGAGVGSVLRSIWRYLKPFASSLRPVAETIGKEGLSSTARVLDQVVKGGDIKEAMMSEGREGARRLLEKASERLQQKGTGRKRKRPLKKARVILKTSDILGKTVPQKVSIYH
jgi:hypothetical protein